MNIERLRYLRLKEKLSVEEILLIPERDRTLDEQFFLRMFLKMEIGFFLDYDRHTLSNVAKILQLRSYDKHETVYEAGDKADESFIVLKGEVSLDMQNHKSQIVTKDFIFGERALDSPEPRSHSAVALRPLLCIVMPKAEFKAQVLPMMLRRKRARLQYLRDHPFFRTWTELHLSQFNASIQTLQYNPGDSVYKEGH